MGGDTNASADARGWLYHRAFPGHWTRSPLYELAEWVNGLAFRKIQFSDTGIPVIKIAEIKGGISGQTKFTQRTFDESVLVRPGDLLFSWSGHPETSIDAYWWRGPEGWLNQHVFRVTPAEGIEPTFFYYLLRYLNPNFVGIARNKQTTGLGHVTKGDLRAIEAAYPDLPEQRAIAHILGTLDDKIELNRRMNETLESMARALFKSWFVDFDPVRAKMDDRWQPGESLPGFPADLYDLFPDRLVESELGEVPEGWEIRPLDAIAEFVNGAACQKFPPEDAAATLPVIKIRELKGGLSSATDRVQFDIPDKHRATDGDVLFSWSGSLVCTLWTGGEAFVNQHVFKVTSSEYPRWLFYYWTKHHLDEFRAIAEAKATTMGHIKRSHLRQALTVVPPWPALARLSEVLEPLVQRQVASDLESSQLADLRDTLLPKLISGELRLPDAEQIVEQAT